MAYLCKRAEEEVLSATKKALLKAFFQHRPKQNRSRRLLAQLSITNHLRQKLQI